MINFDELSIQEIFQLEASEHVASLKALVLDLERGEVAPAAFENAMRLVHTLKGAARLVSADTVQKVAHALEELFLAIQKNPSSLTPSVASECLAALDVIGRAIVISTQGQPDDGVAEVVCQRLAGCLKPTRPGEAEGATGAPAPPANLAAFAGPEPEEPRPGHGDARSTHPPGPEQKASESRPEPDSVEDAGRVPEPHESGEGVEVKLGRTLAPGPMLDSSALAESSVRVTVAQLDALMRMAGELHVSSTHFGRLRLRERLPEMFEDFDVHLRQVVRQLHDHILQIRMLRCGQLFHLFPRFIRDTAAELGKRVELQIVGEGVYVDRAVLQAVTDPLVQLVRNAIVHGIESPGERAGLGKPPVATVRLEASTRGDKVVVAVSDDGRGIDLDAVRRRVVAQNRLPAEAVARLSVDELVQFLFVPGFTTRDQATLTSGRGIGLDIVKSAIEKIGGRVGVATSEGRESRFELTIPLTLSVTHALVVQAGGQSFAFPVLMVNSIDLVGPEEIRTVGTRAALARDERLLPLGSLGLLYDLAPGANPAGRLPTLLLGQGERLCGIMAERFEGEFEIVAQPLDPRLGKVPLVSAAAVLPDGTVALVVDVPEVVHAIHGRAGGLAATRAADDRDTPPRSLGRVLVVDDSLTVREIERKILREAGFEVEVAVDGLDALAKLRRDSRFDLLLVDVDMPRMNGLDLTRMLKADVKYQQIPIIIVSYKDREEDRRRGLEAGADRYVGKGQFENRQFIELIRSLI
jgi:two-component system sensor histidine kinase and response regulator WspE